MNCSLQQRKKDYIEKERQKYILVGGTTPGVTTHIKEGFYQTGVSPRETIRWNPTSGTLAPDDEPPEYWKAI